MSESETRYAICTWKGHCNQQIYNPKQCIEIQPAYPLLRAS